MKHSNQKGSAAATIAIVLALALVGVLGWIFLQNVNKEDSKTGASDTSKSTSTPGNDSTNTQDQYINIKEWSVKLPMNEKLKGKGLTYSVSDDKTAVVFTYPKSKYCGNLGPTMIKRGKLGEVFYTAPNGVEARYDDSSDYTKLNGYYYIVWPSNGSCVDEEDLQSETEIRDGIKEAFKHISEL